MYEKVLHFTYESNRILAICLMCLMDMALAIVCSISFNLLVGEEVLNIDFLEGMSLGEIFIMTVIFAPMLETLIFQLFIIETTLYVFKKAKFRYGYCFAIGISALLFGLTHNYNIYYILYATLTGIYLAVCYIIARNRKDMNGFLTVSIIHANFLVFIIDDWFELM